MATYAKAITINDRRGVNGSREWQYRITFDGAVTFVSPWQAARPTRESVQAFEFEAAHELRRYNAKQPLRLFYTEGIRV